MPATSGFSFISKSTEKVIAYRDSCTIHTHLHMYCFLCTSTRWNKYTEVEYISYEFNISSSCCLWVVRRSQWGIYLIYAQNGDMILDVKNRTAIKSIHIFHGFQVYFLWSSLMAKSILIKSYLMMTVCSTSLLLRYYAIEWPLRTQHRHIHHC